MNKCAYKRITTNIASEATTFFCRDYLINDASKNIVVLCAQKSEMESKLLFIKI